LKRIRSGSTSWLSRELFPSHGRLWTYGPGRIHIDSGQKSASRKCAAAECCSRSDLLEPRFWFAEQHGSLHGLARI